MEINNTLELAVCNLIVDAIDQGSGAGKLKLKDATVVAATLTFSDPAFGAATGNPAIATAGSITPDTNAVGALEVDNYEITDSSDVVIISGDIEDLTIANTLIPAGAEVSCSELTFQVG